MANPNVTHTIGVTLQHGVPTTVHGARGTRTVERIYTTWRYRGRWWQHDIARDYFMVELHGGVTLDIFCEAEHWFATKRI